MRDAIAVGVASGTYGVSFGALAVTSGFSVLQACLLSLLVFTGASQFALIGILASGGGVVSASASALLLGARNTLYGLRLTTLLGLRGWRRPVGAQLVIDESTAMAVAQPTVPLARTGFWATGLSVFVLWNLATLLGALGGTAIGDPRTYGLDAAVGAAFVALLWPRLSGPVERTTAVLGAAVALGLVPFTTPGVPVLAAGGVAVLVGVLVRPREDR